MLKIALGLDLAIDMIDTKVIIPRNDWYSPINKQYCACVPISVCAAYHRTTSMRCSKPSSCLTTPVCKNALHRARIATDSVSGCTCSRRFSAVHGYPHQAHPHHHHPQRSCQRAPQPPQTSGRNTAPPRRAATGGPRTSAPCAGREGHPVTSISVKCRCEVL
jgi:hypothetical protein